MAALIKAVLVNSARPLSGTEATRQVGALRCAAAAAGPTPRLVSFIHIPLPV